MEEEQSAEYESLKRKYKKLIDKLSSEEDEIIGSDFSSDVQPIQNENPKYEIDRWNTTWMLLVSMISKVLPTKKICANNGNEKRTILVDLVNELCESLKKQKSADKQKTHPHKDNRDLPSPIINQKKPKTNPIDEKTNLQNMKLSECQKELNQKVQKLESILNRQIRKQKRALKSHNFRDSPTETSFPEFTATEFKSMESPKMHPHNPIPPKKFSKHPSHNNLEREQNKFQRAYRAHVNQLISVTNKLHEDYHKMEDLAPNPSPISYV
ncbi:hypothetical protein GPJ56_004005 [Histomonas meleagridis]|uniref:uncharacterized protein n=1 Tax=Histomonas meleagridis TaxID=135588 RepID=UPI0035594AAC|nr:hypothetical protein GPJ56_004005 [Histomonas meleagridis]KAH0804869.1 hypothetical protein GO595_002319 [Histomonas meleagridis]